MPVTRILRPTKNWARTSTVSLTTATASAAYPLTKVNDNDVSYPFKTTATGAAEVVFNAGSAVQVDELFLPMYNIPAGTSGVLFQGHTSNSWGTPDVQVTVTIPTFAQIGVGVTPIPESIHVSLTTLYTTAASRTKQWWRLKVPSIGVPLALGEIMFGQTDEYRGFLFPYQTPQESQAVVKQAAQGSRWSFRYPIRRRSISATMPLSSAELETLKMLDDEVGTTADPFGLIPSTTVNLGLIVALDEKLGIGNDENHYPTSFKVTEVNRGMPL